MYAKEKNILQITTNNTNIEIFLKDASRLGGKIFGGYVRNIIIPMKYNINYGRTYDIDIWFKNENMCERFLELYKNFLLCVKKCEKNKKWVYYHKKYKIIIDIYISKNMPSVDFNINRLTYTINNKGLYKPKSYSCESTEQLIKCTIEKKIYPLKTMYDKLVSSNYIPPKRWMLMLSEKYKIFSYQGQALQLFNNKIFIGDPFHLGSKIMYRKIATDFMSHIIKYNGRFKVADNYIEVFFNSSDDVSKYLRSSKIIKIGNFIYYDAYDIKPIRLCICSINDYSKELNKLEKISNGLVQHFKGYR